MKRMGGITCINGRLKASSSVISLLFTLTIFTITIKYSTCYKTSMKNKVYLPSMKAVSVSKVPLLWKPDHTNKSLATTVPLSCPTSSLRCHNGKKNRHQNIKVSKFSKTGIFSDKVGYGGGSRTRVKNLPNPPQVPKSLNNLRKLTSENILEINKFIRKKRHYCKSRHFNNFSCKKLKFSMWLAKQMEKNVTKLNSWFEIVKNNDKDVVPTTSRSSKDVRDIKPIFWPEKIIYRLIQAWGDPEDLFVFYKYKDYINSRELKVTLPFKAELRVAPKGFTGKELSARSSSSAAAKLSQDTARIFWDPGFNLKLKLPFFRDELKVAVSTGPSFVAGIGVGIAVLIVKSLFAPFLIGLKWMVYNLFFKESSPFELMKLLFLSHAPDSWSSAPIPPPSIEHYRPPPVHNPYDNHPPYRGHGHGHHRPHPHPPPRHRPPPYHHHPFGPSGGGGFNDYGPPPPYGSPPYGSPTQQVPSSHYEMDYSPPPPYDLKHQFTHPTPHVSTLAGASPTMSQLEQLYRAQLLEEGLGLKPQMYPSMLQPDPTNSIDMSGTDGPAMEAMDIGMESDSPDTQSSYIPSTGLQAEVEHFDPFYSPLLSKIDSIFTHLGHSDEGCRERVVCSIYKFPVKYAPYSNLLSAQLSKHQSELKRPVSSSSKILRYFRYMKAAKDGQSGENCVDLYQKCDSDTDTVSSLPMITTFHQLSELMTAEASSPGVAIASAMG